MAEHYGFFDGGTEYGQREFNRYFDNIYESGVSIDPNNKLTLNITTDNQNIQIGEGFAIVRGFYLYNDSIKTLNIIRDPNYDRIDRIVLRLDLTTSKVTTELKQGVPGSKPIVPTLQRDNLKWELSLAQVTVPRQGNFTIVDERYRKDLCGSIRPKNLSEYNDMIKSFTEQFDRWFDSQQAKGWRNIFIQAEKPTESVAGSIWIQTI